MATGVMIPVLPTFTRMSRTWVWTWLGLNFKAIAQRGLRDFSPSMLLTGQIVYLYHHAVDFIGKVFTLFDQFFKVGYGFVDAVTQS